MDKRKQRQFQGFHSVLMCPNHSKSKAKVTLLSNKEMPIIFKINNAFWSVSCKSISLFFFVFVVVFSIQIGTNSF